MGKDLFIFFGIPGGGKSYFGRKFAEANNLYFYEADVDYTEETRQLAEKDSELAKEQFYNVVISNINKRLAEGKKVVVATALGKNKFRHKFIDKFGDRVVFVCIKANREKHLEYILERELKNNNNLNKDELKKHIERKYSTFEDPYFNCIEINNNFDQESYNILINKLDANN